MATEAIEAPEASAMRGLVERWREDTPGCTQRIHLNNAGAGLMPRPVADAIRDHIELESRIGGYEAAESMAGKIEETYAELARLIGCAPRNVAVVENATVGFSQALSAFDFRPGDRIVTSRSDYPSNQIMYISLARRCGVEIVMADDLPPSEGGGIDPESVRGLLRDPRCRLVSLTWVPTNSGLVQPVQEVGAVCATAGVPFLVDACQAVGQLPVDVARLQCDFLAATGRKFLRGPRGIGFLYVSDHALERGVYPLYLDMRAADWTGPDDFRLAGSARRFENWEYPYALVLGLRAAARYANQAGAAALERTRDLAAYLRGRLEEIPTLRLLDRHPHLCAIIIATLANWPALDLEQRLRDRGINVNTSYRRDGFLDLDPQRAAVALRISPHYYNTRQELDTLVAALGALADGAALPEIAAAPPASP